MTPKNYREEKTRDEESLRDLRKALLSAVPPMAEAELRRDLWPAMAQRMKHPPARIPWLSRVSWTAQIPWFDWALLGVAAVALLFFPALIPALLYHF